MRKKLLLAAIASVGTLAFGGAALAASVVSGAYTLDDTQFGAQTGVHSDGAQDVPSNLLNAHVNQEGSAVTFQSTDLIKWNPGGGEATLSGDPSFDNLLVTFAHGWGTVTFNLMDSTGASSDFDLVVNGGAATFSQGGNCTFCIVDNNGEGKFTLTGPNITTLAFTFDPAIETGKQFRVMLPVGNPIPEPATWAMMILGFGGVGGMLRRRRHSLVPA